MTDFEVKLLNIETLAIKLGVTFLTDEVMDELKRAIERHKKSEQFIEEAKKTHEENGAAIQSTIDKLTNLLHGHLTK